MPKKHSHEWITLMRVLGYEADPGTYEYDVPFIVEYCGCGERRSREMNAAEIEQTRIDIGLPAEQIFSE